MRRNALRDPRLVPFPPRDFAPGIQHVWINATGNEPYYLDDIDRMAWVRLLVAVLEEFDWSCIAFCQLTTHVHLLLSVPDRSLPRGMQYLNREYSRSFNARHTRGGQFVRRRYSNRRIDGAADILGAYGYVVLNAEMAGVCEAAELWHWSSYGTTLGIAEAFPFVDASLVLAEFDYSIPRLRAFVDGRREHYLALRDTSWYQIPGRG